MVDDTLESDAVNALSERYAKGEIDIDEFEAALDRLGDRDDDPSADELLEDESDGTYSDDDLTPGMLMGMGEAEASEELTPEQYDRWHKLNDLNEQAEETKFEWQEQSKQVQEVTVNADMEQLGTELDLFGNSVLVHIDPSDRKFRRATNALEEIDEFEDESEVVELDDETQEEIADRLQDMLDAVLVRWDGTRWSDIPEDKRGAVLAQCRDKWGVDGLMLAWVNIGQAVNDEREDIEETIKSFRGA